MRYSIMATCRNCGNLGNIQAKFCPNCGEPLGSTKDELTLTNNKDSSYGSFNPNFNPGASSSSSSDYESTNMGFCVLGFCFPLVGLILFLIFMNDKPGYSRGAGIGALISVIISIVGYVILWFLRLWQFAA